MIYSRAFCFAGIALGLSDNDDAWAGGLSKPADDPILTITALIGVTNIGDVGVLDRAMIEGLAITSFRILTPWYSQPVTFEDVLLTVLLERVAATDGIANTIALSDHRTESSIADFAHYHPILAFKRDDRYLGIRDRIPLRLVGSNARQSCGARLYSQPTSN